MVDLPPVRGDEAMKTLLATAAVVATLFAAPADAMSGKIWYENCAGTNRAVTRGGALITCASYVDGLVGGLFLMKVIVINPPRVSDGTPLVCVDARFKIQQFVDVGLAYMQVIEPQRLDGDAAGLLTEAFIKAWPCKQ
jgi:hypothetical protein